MNEVKNTTRNDIDKNEDKSRPVATGLGALAGGAAGGVAGGAAAGAAVGGMTGPVGLAVGAVVGAVAGGLAGKSFANVVDPVAEEDYWRDNHSKQPYAKGSDYDEYRPAYGYGVDAHTRYPGQAFDDVEPELERDWNARRGTSGLEWDRARQASRDAWQRVSDTAERATPGDSDRDGK